MSTDQPRPSARLLKVCALFGISHNPVCNDAGRARSAAHQLRSMPRGHIALLTGPSGGGKSLILRQLASETRPAPILVDPSRRIRWRASAVIDQFPAPIASALACLARAGLAEAAILAAHPRNLSDGQRFRLLLALAMHRALNQRPRPMLLIDEFCSTLDRITARNIARTFHRWIKAERLRAICATANDDILETLAPDTLVYQPLHAAAIVRNR